MSQLRSDGTQWHQVSLSPDGSRQWQLAARDRAMRFPAYVQQPQPRFDADNPWQAAVHVIQLGGRDPRVLWQSAAPPPDGRAAHSRTVRVMPEDTAGRREFPIEPRVRPNSTQWR